MATLNREPHFSSFLGTAVCVGNKPIKPMHPLLRAPTVFDSCRPVSGATAQSPVWFYCCACAESEAGSTFTPMPIVLDTESFLR